MEKEGVAQISAADTAGDDDKANQRGEVGEPLLPVAQEDGLSPVEGGGGEGATHPAQQQEGVSGEATLIPVQRRPSSASTGQPEEGETKDSEDVKMEAAGDGDAHGVSGRGEESRPVASPDEIRPPKEESKDGSEDQLLLQQAPRLLSPTSSRNDSPKSGSKARALPVPNKDKKEARSRDGCRSPPPTRSLLVSVDGDGVDGFEGWRSEEEDGRLSPIARAAKVDYLEASQLSTSAMQRAAEEVEREAFRAEADAQVALLTARSEVEGENTADGLRKAAQLQTDEMRLLREAAKEARDELEAHLRAAAAETGQETRDALGEAGAEEFNRSGTIERASLALRLRAEKRRKEEERRRRRERGGQGKVRLSNIPRGERTELGLRTTDSVARKLELSGAQRILLQRSRTLRQQEKERLRLTKERMARLAQPKGGTPDMLYVDPESERHAQMLLRTLGGREAKLLIHGSLDDARECVFSPRTRGAGGAQRHSDDGQDEDAKARGDMFLFRMDATEEHFRRAMEHRRGEEAYKLVQDKKVCPQCGAAQSFDEVQEKRKKCVNCAVEYKAPSTWGQVERRFFDKMQRWEEKKRHTLQDHERRTQLESSQRKDLEPRWEEVGEEFLYRMQEDMKSREEGMRLAEAKVAEMTPFKPQLTSEYELDESRFGDLTFLERAQEDMRRREEARRDREGQLACSGSLYGHGCGGTRGGGGEGRLVF